MTSGRTFTTIAATLALVSCGTAPASSTDASDPAPTATDAVPHKSSSSMPLPTSTDSAASSVPHGITDAEAAFPARLALTTKDGQVLTFSPHEDPVVTPGVMAPTGKVVVS